jgi:hypothetical protein
MGIQTCSNTLTDWGKEALVFMVMAPARRKDKSIRSGDLQRFAGRPSELSKGSECIRIKLIFMYRPAQCRKQDFIPEHGNFALRCKASDV